MVRLVVACDTPAGKHLFDGVRGRNCRREVGEVLQAGLSQQHAGEGVSIRIALVLEGATLSTLSRLGWLHRAATCPRVSPGRMGPEAGLLFARLAAVTTWPAATVGLHARCACVWSVHRFFHRHHIRRNNGLGCKKLDNGPARYCLYVGDFIQSPFRLWLVAAW